MRELTFKGFLAQYVKALSYSDTLNMKKLLHEATEGNHRLLAPLLLYAVETEKVDLMQKHVKDAELLSELSLLSAGNLEDRLQRDDVAEPYRKVWNSYLVTKNAPGRDGELKEAMRQKILSMQQNSHCSTYRIYTDLRLNPGNINHWLKHGDSRKVSYQTAEKIVSYLVVRQPKSD